MMKNLVLFKNIGFEDMTLDCQGIPMTEQIVNINCPGISLEVEGILLICKSCIPDLSELNFILILGSIIIGTTFIVLIFNFEPWDWRSTWVPNPNYGGIIPSKYDAPVDENNPRRSPTPNPDPSSTNTNTNAPTHVPLPQLEPKTQAWGPPHRFEEYKKS